MTWESITPRAPWSGGLYERLKGLTKKAMRRALRRKLLWERELITLLAEIEGDLDEFKPGKPDTKERLSKYWMGTLKVLDAFWETWKRE
ncbi:unnamed protein product, partial [Onchocerca ochengi]|uniref:Uncharacterized protein n=1 Tax=Onchocerca ochengi TaxID=42157 RepID=A0A182EZX9_ONCOC